MFNEYAIFDAEGGFMIKLIATDIDGTLLGLTKTMPERADEIITKLIKKGILFVPASGRSYSAIEHLFVPFINDIAIIAENGGVVNYKGKELFTKTLQKDTLIEVMEFLDQDNIFPIINSRYESYLLPQIVTVREKVAHYCTAMKDIDRFEDIEKDIVSVSIWVTDGSVVEVCNELNKRFNDRAMFVATGKFWIDAIPMGVNKGIGLKMLMKKLNIKSSEVMAFGDYNNDIEMLQLAETSYVMDHATDEMKAYGNFVCSPEEIMSEIEKHAL